MTEEDDLIMAMLRELLNTAGIAIETVTTAGIPEGFSVNVGGRTIWEGWELP